MISNRIDKLFRNTKYVGDINDLLNMIEAGDSYVTEFINTFTTNKTHFLGKLFILKI